MFNQNLDEKLTFLSNNQVNILHDSCMHLFLVESRDELNLKV